MSQPRPNIVFINVEQWRADCLGFAGHPVVETPHLDRLSEEGMHFTQAYAAVPSCVAARASLMTGLTPRSHGRVGYKDGVPWNYQITLPGLLARAGYHTQGIGKMHFYPARSLLGFHNIVLHDGFLHHERGGARDVHLVDDYLPWLRRRHGPFADYVDTGLGCNGYVVRPWIYEEMLHPSAWATSEAIDFLRRRDPRQPFFLYLSYHRPHPPLDPPAAYLDLYQGKELPPPPLGDWREAVGIPPAQLSSPKPRDPAQRDRARRAYYAQMTFIDHQINRLTHALWIHQCLDNTCLLFCADHGELLYDHHQLGKVLPYDGSARIPFLIHLPRSWNCPGGASIEAPVELRDVLPTLCDVAGVLIPESVEGRSLLPFCREPAQSQSGSSAGGPPGKSAGESPGNAPESAPQPASWRQYLHGEHAYGKWSNHWLTDGKQKYIWYSQSGIEQLFDLMEDPQELKDLSQSRPEAIRSWRERLAQELSGREEGYVREGRLVAGRTPQHTLREAGLPG